MALFWMRTSETCYSVYPGADGALPESTATSEVDTDMEVAAITERVERLEQAESA